MNLVAYIEKKIELLEEATDKGFSWLMNKEDKEELKTMEDLPRLEQTLVMCVGRSKLSLYHDTPDNLLCPWCLSVPSCSVCNFGARHGYCIEGSDYYNATVNGSSLAGILDKIPNAWEQLFNALNKKED